MSHLSLKIKWSPGVIKIAGLDTCRFTPTFSRTQTERKTMAGRDMRDMINNLVRVVMKICVPRNGTFFKFLSG
jgi:hypothetical protein